MKKSTEVHVQENGCKGSPRDKRPNKENEKDDRRVLLAITVEIEDGCVEHIEMKEGDSAEAVAKKFCGDHFLPEQFVAPLTEHIVSNIVSLSKENKELSYHGTEEHGRSLSYESTRLYQPKPGTSPKHESGLDQECKSGRWCCKQRTDGDIQARERSKNTCIVSQSKNKTKIRRRLSERLLAPTLTSLAKRPQAVEKDKSKELASVIKRPLNAKAVTFFTFKAVKVQNLDDCYPILAS
ncbi:hypothetical protein Mapa_005901 [Marchantia paleacea]|nr:hypothetical protein Mapa_005901 [Marchantia paleacea]